MKKSKVKKIKVKEIKGERNQGETNEGVISMYEKYTRLEISQALSWSLSKMKCLEYVEKSLPT